MKFLLFQTSITQKAGFTLIEILTVLIISALISSIAYPSYLSSIRKARRTDALITLAHDQLALEECFNSNYSYIADCASLPAFPHLSLEHFYSISLLNRDTKTYTLIATALESQSADTQCASFKITNNGVKIALNSAGNVSNECWG